jgi:predicted ATPase/DNA-binding CsgD family transcriptional regulator
MGAGPSHSEQSNVAAGVVTLLPSEAAPHNLPVSLTSFVGRDRELRELREALTTTRLLTLTGPGGSGKTRLALRVASEILDRFPGGVWWVDLVPVADDERVGAAVAEAVGVRPLPGMTELQGTCAYLASQRALVVLDNCEHVLEGCARAAEALLQTSAAVVVLATSRATLGVGGEADWRVPSLSLSADAESLFAERARKVHPGFAMSEANATTVTRICDELDGLPLAIELAAARLRMLSVEQIADAVSERFRLLTGGPRTAEPRLQTLRASMDWSHDLLSADERVLLRRVAVFTGGLTLDAVEQVCTGDGIERGRVLDVLGSLVDQSLVICDERDAAVRYRLLETVRQYGLERLAEAGEEDSLRHRHRDRFLALAEEAAPQLESGRQDAWFAVLDGEAANLAAAIDWALGSEPRLALRLCAALTRWWNARGRFAEAELALSRSLEACGDREPGLRGRALYSRTFLAVRRGDYAAVETHATAAIALAHEAGDEATAARARGELGTALASRSPGAARSELARSAELARAAGDDWALVTAKLGIAMTHVLESDHAQAASANDEVAGLAEQSGDPLQVGMRWYLAAVMASIDGRFAKARDAIARMPAAGRRGELVIGEGLAAAAVATVDVLVGEGEPALERLPGQLARALSLGVGMVVPALLHASALAELATGRLEQARDRLEGLIALVDGRDVSTTSWTLSALAEARRLLGDGAAEATAHQAQASGERMGNRLVATRGRYTLGRLAAARGDWTAAQQHALAHLDACAEGGHMTYVPGCLDALAEVAAGLDEHQDAVRLFAAAARARAEIGVVRIPPEADHWAAIDGRLREALGAEAYEVASIQGAELSIADALEWARRARGPRRRPPGGWAALTPTEARVAELAAEGLTNSQIGERMFISPETVKTHLSHIYRKLGVRSRVALTAHAVRRTP